MQPERTLDRRFCVLFLLLLTSALRLDAQSLAGSKASMLRQSHQAHAHEYTYLRTSSQVRDFARRGLLVRLSGNSNYRVASASFPYARPEVKTFLERLGKQYRSACGERLVVTSLTRPTTRQPRNASPLSVHPTGMAVDLRRSARPACRAWLEKTLLRLEAKDVVEATKETHPPHYHVTRLPLPLPQLSRVERRDRQLQSIQDGPGFEQLEQELPCRPRRQPLGDRQAPRHQRRPHQAGERHALHPPEARAAAGDPRPPRGRPGSSAAGP